MSNIEQTLSIIKPDAVERNLIEEIKNIFIKNKLNIKEYHIEHNSSEAILPPNNYGVFKNDKVKTSYNIEFKNLKESLPEYIKWYNKNY